MQVAGARNCIGYVVPYYMRASRALMVSELGASQVRIKRMVGSGSQLHTRPKKMSLDAASAESFVATSTVVTDIVSGVTD
mmetsp:Transcript_31828/g.49359  ORF Transcript_31828/g.49359 Transcript_31828/m.49359 type:complete len:80 (+) Transcript_31828:151-390(+)